MKSAAASDAGEVAQSSAVTPLEVWLVDPQRGHTFQQFLRLDRLQCCDAAAREREVSEQIAVDGLLVRELALLHGVTEASFETLPIGSGASRRAIAHWSDGTHSEVLRWHSDELLFSEGDLVGKTREQIRALHFRRDRDWLQS